MQARNILVGVDLSQADRLVASELTTANKHAVEKAIWLGKLQSAKLTFFAALELSAHTQHLIEEDERNYSDVDDAALNVLKELAQQAKEAGLESECKLAYGKAWHEMIEQVLAAKHDLVIVGTRDLSSVQRLILGSTGMKLLRYCPCPVWVTKPEVDVDIVSIMVATDLSAVGEKAIRTGAEMAVAEEAELHIVHSVEYPLDRPLRFSQASTEEIDEYRKKIRHEAEQTLAGHLDCEEVKALPAPPQVHLSDAAPEVAIFEAIREHNIGLLVMGTIARAGLQGLLVGNTAERILPELPCSVLAIKPDDFVCPVKPD